MFRLRFRLYPIRQFEQEIIAEECIEDVLVDVGSIGRLVSLFLVDSLLIII